MSLLPYLVRGYFEVDKEGIKALSVEDGGDEEGCAEGTTAASIKNRKVFTFADDEAIPGTERGISSVSALKYLANAHI